MASIRYALIVGDLSDERRFTSDAPALLATPPQSGYHVVRMAALVRRHGGDGSRLVIVSCQDANRAGYGLFADLSEDGDMLSFEISTATGNAICEAGLPRYAPGRWMHVVCGALFDGTTRALNTIWIWVNGDLVALRNDYSLGDYVAPASGTLFEVGGSDGPGEGGPPLDVAGVAFSAGQVSAPTNASDIFAMFESVRQSGVLTYNAGSPDTSLTWSDVWTLENYPSGFSQNDSWSPDHGSHDLEYQGFSNVERREDTAPLWL